MDQENNCHQLVAKYYANELSLKKGGSDVERLGNALYNSKIELTPHQIQAALFAFKSPLDKGVILADEVGLGKTIEAGIVIAQSKFESNSRTLVVAPASLTKQWEAELADKFGLKSVVMDRKQYNNLAKNGINPFNTTDDVVICSYQMCAMFQNDIIKSNIKLVVLDEAHKLRNIHNEKSITANKVRDALIGKKKVLLTATPIQNSLLDLYGLSTVIDDNIFGDKESFKYNYIKNVNGYDDLNDRLKLLLHRTLRSQVSQYIKFTKRIPQTFAFELNAAEQEIYDYIRNLIINSDEESYLIPSQQKHLVTLILCKLLGSSTSAIVSTLEKMQDRLLRIKQSGNYEQLDPDFFESDEDDIDEIFLDEDIKNQIDIKKLDNELTELSLIIEKAKAIQDDSKYSALLKALRYSFEHIRNTGANKKVLIFTESRQTQIYLMRKLIEDGYEKVALYNGSNNEEISQKIYKQWALNHPEEALNNSKALNMKSAIIEAFKKDFDILIATEAGAEGLNLQFCSLVVNYDLPWNPQRVEQRIGRCHRLGQTHDVVVINFISSSNAVETRIYELLNNKFKVFNEILGSSDSIIGNLEDGKDLEKSIVNIYKTCRTKTEIDDAFDELQKQYKDEIDASMDRTRKELLDNFEEDIQKLFTNVMGEVTQTINHIEYLLWMLAKSQLVDAVFDEKNKTFTYKDNFYYLKKDSYANGNWLSVNSRLAQKLIDSALSTPINAGKVTFDITNYPYKIGKIEALKGKKGSLIVSKLEIESLESEEHLVFNGMLNDGTRIESDICERLFRLNSTENYDAVVGPKEYSMLEEDNRVNVQAVINDSQIKNNELISSKINQINMWADDKIEAIQLSVEEMRNKRKELQKQSDSAVNMIEKERIESEIIQISKKIKQSWLKLATEEDEIEEKRHKLINDIRKEVLKSTSNSIVFAISFEVI